MSCTWIPYVCSYIPKQAPRTSRASLGKGRSQANAVAQQALIAHWQSIVKCLNNNLKIMRANYVSGIRARALVLKPIRLICLKKEKEAPFNTLMLSL